MVVKSRTHESVYRRLIRRMKDEGYDLSMEKHPWRDHLRDDLWDAFLNKGLKLLGPNSLVTHTKRPPKGIQRALWGICTGYVTGWEKNGPLIYVPTKVRFIDHGDHWPSQHDWVLSQMHSDKAYQIGINTIERMSFLLGRTPEAIRSRIRKLSKMTFQGFDFSESDSKESCCQVKVMLDRTVRSLGDIYRQLQAIAGNTRDLEQLLKSNWDTL